MAFTSFFPSLLDAFLPYFSLEFSSLLPRSRVSSVPLIPLTPSGWTRAVDCNCCYVTTLGCLHHTLNVYSLIPASQSKDWHTSFTFGRFSAQVLASPGTLIDIFLWFLSSVCLYRARN